ncbi:MAG: gamma-glutamyltransferase [Pseudomonadota bacterium]
MKGGALVGEGRRRLAAGRLLAQCVWSVLVFAGRRLGFLSLVGGLLLSVGTVGADAQTQADPEIASGFAPKPLAVAERWMVVAAHPLAAEAGRRMLREGGSAADAAIAAQLVLNVVEPQSSGLGGGGFALTYDAASRRLEAWDGRETAPARASPTQFLGPDGAPLPFLEAATSGLAIGAPGLARLLEALHQEQGELPWSRLFEDAIRLAEDGFPVSPRLHASLSAMGPRLRADAEARALFFTKNDAPLSAGAALRQPRLAATLRRLAEGGADAFYRGPIALAIVNAARAEPRPGALSTRDLRLYRAVKRRPVCGVFRGRYEVCGMPPPSSGGVTVAQILGLMDHFDPETPLVPRAHLFLEASRLAYADRNRFLADPDHVAQPEGLLDPAYLTARAQRMDRRRAAIGPASPGAPRWRAPIPLSDDAQEDRPGTTHLTVVDGAGDVVSLTSSIEVSFGAGRMAAGLFLNNQLTDFSFRPESDGRAVANALGPGKRPRSSMAPTIVLDRRNGRRPMLALGSPGGSRIIEYVAWATLGMLDEGLDPAAAAARPHLSHRNRAPALVEARADADALAAELAAFGHAPRRGATTSGLHIIQIVPAAAQTGRRLLGGADPRREGVALGD